MDRFVVAVRGDDGEVDEEGNVVRAGGYVLATRRVWTDRAEAEAYARTCRPDRVPVVIAGDFAHLRSALGADRLPAEVLACGMYPGGDLDADWDSGMWQDVADFLRESRLDVRAVELYLLAELGGPLPFEVRRLATGQVAFLRDGELVVLACVAKEGCAPAADVVDAVRAAVERGEPTPDEVWAVIKAQCYRPLTQPTAEELVDRRRWMEAVAAGATTLGLDAWAK
jgi:hypothetical protein